MSRFNLFVIACAMLIPSLAWAQQPGGNPPPGGNQPGGRGGFDPAAMRERWMTGIKEQMGASDDEWKVISPKLTKVMDAQRDARGGFFMRRGGGGDQPQTPVAKASSDLRATLEKKDAPADEIASKLKALREAREKAKADLTAAQKDLKELLTQRQEAVLVQMGMLE